MERDLSVKEAAQIAGCAASTMRKWINQKLIKGATKKDKGWRVPEEHLRNFLIDSDSRAHATAVTKSRSERVSDVEQLLRDQIRSLQDQLKIEQERSQNLESDNRQLNAEIKAILGHKAGLTLKGVLSRWVRT